MSKLKKEEEEYPKTQPKNPTIPEWRPPKPEKKKLHPQGHQSQTNHRLQNVVNMKGRTKRRTFNSGKNRNLMNQNQSNKYFTKKGRTRISKAKETKRC